MRKLKSIKREVRKMWAARTKVIPAVMGALGSEPIVNLANYQKVFDVEISGKMIQTCTLLGSARILRKVLEI